MADIFLLNPDSLVLLDKKVLAQTKKGHGFATVAFLGNRVY